MTLWKAIFKVFWQIRNSIIGLLCCIMTFQRKENVYFHYKLRGRTEGNEDYLLFIREHTWLLEIITSACTIGIVRVPIMSEKLKKAYQEWDLWKIQGIGGGVGCQLWPRKGFPVTHELHNIENVFPEHRTKNERDRCKKKYKSYRGFV